MDFTLTGKTNDIPNNALIYLVDFDNRLLIDTARVENNFFVFKKKLPRSPIRIMLSEKGEQNSKIFWLENSLIIFDASKTDFKNASIIGSETEDLSIILKKRLEATEYRNIDRIEIEFIENNPSNIISVSLLLSGSKKWGKEKTKELYDKLSVKNQTSFYGKKLKEYFTLNKALQIGDEFLNLKISDESGNIRELSDLKGKTVLLEFWASWCKPCRAENPNLIKNYEKYKDFGFEIFAVSLDDSKTNWLKAIEQDNTKWLHVSELRNDDKASIIYGVSAIPDNFLIDRNGIIVGRNLRGNDLNRKLSELMPVANTVYKK
ncbi:redoxin domain-containing protein [Mariniflexile sp.]|uniref:redoxin domain-containing protein n=1 Tax=Mariniflexile sp. TaxID=1979402 RepID=UPI004048D957